MNVSLDFETQCEGTVKSYNGLKGFGFIVSDACEGDVFFSRNELPQDMNEVQGKWMEGRSVSFTASVTPDGKNKAKAVFLVISSEGESYPGAVKAFSQKNGYGFITSSCVDGDVRFDRNSFPNLPPNLDIAGKLVTFALQIMPDGKKRAAKVDFQSGQTAKTMQMQGMGASWYPQGMQMMQVPMGKGGMPMMQVPMSKGGMYQMAPQMHQAGGSTVGTIKSFSEKNGYGFITVNGMPDIKFGKADVVGGSVVAGTTVRFYMTSGPDGRMQAQQVSTAGAKRPAPAANGPPVKMQKGAGKHQGQGQLVSGFIKSFNSAKGYGFITAPGLHDDVFFMKSDVPPEAQMFVEQGVEVSFEATSGPDGRLRAQGVVMGM